MIEIELSDGSIAEFPDGTSDDAIKYAIDKLQMRKPPATVSARDPSVMDHMAVGADRLGLPGGRMRSTLQGLGAGLTAGIEGAANLASFGFDDEIAAGLNSGFGVLSDYDEALKKERARLEANRAASPKAAVAGQLGGALLGGAGLVKGGLSAAAKAKTLPGMIAGGSLDGLIFGGLAGAGNTEGGLAERAKGAGVGAGTGAVVGGLAPPALALAGAGARPVIDVGRRLFQSAPKQVNARMANTAKAAGVSADDIATRLDDLGDESVLLDVLGRPGQAIGRSASNTNSQAGQILDDALNDRISGQGERITGALAKATGQTTPKTVVELQDEVTRSLKPEITKAYNAARKAGFDFPDEPFEDLLKSPTLQSAMKTARKRVADRMAGQPGGISEPSKLDLYDETKKVLDGLSSKAARAGDNSKAASLSQLAKDWRNTVDEFIPEYAGARALAQNKARQLEAIELGVEGAQRNIPADFGSRAAALNPALNIGGKSTPVQGPSLLPLAARGFTGDKTNQIANALENADLVKGKFSTKNQKDVVRALFGEAKAPAIEQRLAGEKAFNASRAAMQGGSPTARFLAEMGLGGTAGAGVGLALGGDVHSAGIGGLIGAGARFGGPKMLAAMTARKEAEIAPLIAKILVSRGLPQKVAEKVSKSGDAQKAIARALALTAGANAPQSTGQ